MRSALRQIRVADAAVALAVAALQLGVATLATSHHHRSLGLIAIALLSVGPVALLVRRRRSTLALAVTFAGALAYSAVGYYPRGLVFPALVVAFWSAMLAGQRRLGWATILLCYPLFVILLPLTGAQQPPGLVWASGIASWMLLLAASAEIVRVRQERSQEAARAGAEQSLRLAGQERMRIAAELHDVLAHNISLINVQAGVALHLIDEHPEQARSALAAIKQASKDALAELRSVLDTLRVPEERAPRAPADGLFRLSELIGRTRDAGLQVEAQIQRPARPLPATVDLAAYRIIQEALTNVRRHAPGAPTRVKISCTDSELVLEIDNEPTVRTHANGDGGGNGIPGMQERVAALGGSFHAGSRPGGGYRVHATLPLPTPR